MVFLKGWFGLDRKLKTGVVQNLKALSSRGRVWDRDIEGRSCFYDSQVWPDVPAYKEFVLNSPCSEIAGRLMGSLVSIFFFDAIFVRTLAAQFHTPFHQDDAYWSVKGFNTCSVWMPLVEVEKRNALEFLRGSHRWTQKYKQMNFGTLIGDSMDLVVFSDEDTVPFPDIDGHRDDYEILAWNMEPRDAVFFNARIFQGGSGNLAPDRCLKVFNSQWLGDDVRVCFRPQGMDPDHSRIMTEFGLSDGDRPGGEMYPLVWAG